MKKLIGSLTVFLALVGCSSESSNAPTTVSGVVNDDVGAPVAAATVSAVSSSAALTVSSAQAAQVTTTTGADGSYTITLPDGIHQVTISKDGFIGQAGEPGPRPMNFDLAGHRPPHERMDADGDGIITQAEWKGPSDIFLKIDADGSGTLTQAELEAAHADREKNHPRRPKMDTDGDGLISKAEWMGPPDHFSEIDADGSGSVTKEELEAQMKKRGMRGPPPPRG